MTGSRWVMRGKASQQSGVDVSEILDYVSSFALANLLWVLLSLPIVTLPAATAGLFTATSPWVRGKKGEVFRDFLDGMRQFWWKCTLVVVVDMAIGGLIAVNLTIFRMMALPQPVTIICQSAMLCLAVVGVMINLYLWPLIVLFHMPLNRLVFAAAQMVFAFPARSVVLLLAGLLPIALGAVLPSIVMVMVVGAACALIINWGTWQVIRQFIAAEDLARLEVTGSFLFRGQNKRSI